MTSPRPRLDPVGNERSHLQRQPVANLDGPLFGYDADRGFRCRQNLGQSAQGTENTLVAGQTSQIHIEHEANHPGDCSAWISYDCVGVTGDCEPEYFFKVQDFPGCGTDGIVPPTDFFLDLDLPAELPPCDRCVLRWEWIALQQVVNTENYVTCADVVIQSSSGPVIPSPFIQINGIQHLPATADKYRQVYNFQGPGFEWLVGPAAATYTPCTGTEVGCVSSSGVVPPPTTTLPPSPPYTAAPTPLSGSGDDDDDDDSSGPCSGIWGQCDGASWSGPFCCTSGLTCVFDNEYYSQCRTATATSAPTTATPTDAPVTSGPTSAPVTSPPTTAAPSLGPTTGVPSTAPVTSPPSATACSPQWGQCAGLTWTGPTCCEEGLLCVYNNDYYSQCRASTSAPTTKSSTSAPVTSPPTTAAPSLGPTTGVPSTAPVTSPPSATACSPQWGQCAGLTWNGPTCCEEGLSCVYNNDYYSQCLKSSSPSPPSPSPSPTPPSPTATDAPTPLGQCAGLYEQCDGQNFAGPRCCTTGECTYDNQWYSQCEPGPVVPVDCDAIPNPADVSRLNDVGVHGKLTLDGVQLVDGNGNAIQLRGMSSHGIAYYPECYTKASIKHTAQKWGANLFRAAMYVSPQGAYADQPAANLERIKDYVQWTKELGIYIIIDWHILSEQDPNVWLDGQGASTGLAIDFWTEVATLFKDEDHVLYEIANEPNNVAWSVVKAYHDSVISAIRQIDPETIIIAGTPTWSQDIDAAYADPVAQTYNVMYAFHFYAGTHMGLLDSKIKPLIDLLPIFVTEWGTSEASGNGGPYLANADTFLDFFDGKTSGSNVIVSWAQWSFADKAETSAALSPGACTSAQYDDTSCSGSYIRNRLKSSALEEDSGNNV